MPSTMIKKPKKGPSKKPDAAMAIQASNKDGVHHAVGFWNLRVLIVKDGNQFFAQCYEIDYAACGSSVDDAKRNFEKGFMATVYHHLKMFGSINAMMQPVASDFWSELMEGARGMHFTIEHQSLHKVLPQRSEMFAPYQNFEYAHVMAAA